MNVPISSVVSRMTMEITITGLRRWHWRVVVGMWFVRLGARIIGMKSVEFYTK